eukprot:m.51504 g.51504  ORF g.51504 m.51504 type:complete len:763 (-) comp21457_c0_seq1:316-2604(-)
MGMEFEYDDTGTTSYVFVLSGLIIYIFLATCQKLNGKSGPTQDEIAEEINAHCQTSLCSPKKKILEARVEKKTKGIIPVGNAIYYGAIVLLLALAYKVSQFEAESVYSPFDVLGLDEAANTKEIKDKYRELSRIWHPDRNPDDESAADKFIMIHKAYEALTDPTTRENWEKYGNPDGRQVAEFGIALPAWIVDKDNSHLVLGAYVFIFMFCLPVYIGCWWYNRTKYYSDDVMLPTMKIFDTYMQADKNQSVMNIVKKLSWCEEYQLIPIREEMDKMMIKKVVKEIKDLKPALEWRYPNLPGLERKPPACAKSRALLHAHLARMHGDLPAPLLEDLNFCLKRIPMLIDAMIDIVQYRRNLRASIATMHLSQMMVQGFESEHDEKLLQIPHITPRLVKALKSKTAKIYKPEDLFALSAETRRKLLKDLSVDQMTDVEAFGAQFPFVEVTYDIRVADEDDITANSVITVTATLKRRNMSEIERADNDESLLKLLTRKEAGNNVADEDEVEAEKQKLIRMYEAKNAKSKKKTKKKPKKKAAAADAETKTGADDVDVDDKDKLEDEGVDADADAETIKGENGDDNDDDDDGNEDGDSEEESKPQKSHRTPKVEEDDEDDGDFDWGDDDAFEGQREKKAKLKKIKLQGARSFPVHCPLFPEAKQERWWVFLGNKQAGFLQTDVKKVVSLTDEEEIDLQFMAPPRACSLQLTLFVISDSYHQLAFEIPLKIDVKAGAVEPSPEEEIQSEEEDNPFNFESSDESDDDDFA